MKRFILSLTAVMVLGVGVLTLTLVGNNAPNNTNAQASSYSFSQEIEPLSTNWVRWQQPTWQTESNAHGTVSVRMANGSNVSTMTRNGFNAFNRFGCRIEL